MSEKRELNWFFVSVVIIIGLIVYLASLLSENSQESENGDEKHEESTTWLYN